MDHLSARLACVLQRLKQLRRLTSRGVALEKAAAVADEQLSAMGGSNGFNR